MNREQRVGLFVLLALGIFIVFLELTTGFMPFRKTYTVYGLFRNVRGIQEGTDVSVSGMNVAKVRELVFKDGKVKVAIAVPEEVRLYKDATATLEASIMGATSTSTLNVEPGSSANAVLKNGDYLNVKESPSVAEVLDNVNKAVASLQDAAESFGGGKEGPLATLNAFFEKHEKEMGDMVHNFSVFSEKLAKGEGRLGKRLEDDTLYGQLSSTMSSLQDSIKRLEEGKGTLGKLVADDSLYKKTTAMMDSLDRAIEDLAEVAQKVNRGEGTLGKLVTDDSLYKKAEESLANVDRATKGMEDQGPISAIGAAAGAIF
jgi:phospholipid/cholesterol/gamma-HCH transport system substrate-binding protein